MTTLRQTLDDGLRHHRAGRLDDAGLCYRAALAEAPDDAEANHLAGVLAFQSGRIDEAATRFGRAVAGDSGNAKYHGNLGAALIALGRHGDAVAALERSVSIDPAEPGFRINLATAYREAGRLDDAIRAYHDVTARQPDDAPAHTGLAVALLRADRLEEAQAAAETAIAIAPNDAEAHNVLGTVLQALRRDDAALAAFERAAALAPGFTEARCNLGLALQERHRYAEAEMQYRAALDIRPNDATAHAGLARTYRSQGRVEEALPLYRRAVELAPAHARHRANLLFNLLGSPDTDGRRLCAEHRAWAARFADPLAAHGATCDALPDPDRPLRIGYVSPDFRDHPVGRLLLPVLQSHDSAAVEAFCYAEGRRSDAVTAALRGAAYGWRDISGLDDEAVALVIAADRIDIAVDLAGHSARNRLLALARRPVPVQATWLGYPSTTGMQAIDWLIADPVHAPEGSDDEFAERVMRLPHDLLCFVPPADAPAIAPPPVSTVGYITFGSFNNPGKLSSTTLALWSRVLAAVPDSRLLLRYHVLEDDAARGHLRARFAAAGVDPARISFGGKVAYADVLETYNQVDIALDTTPYSGTMTTLEALWMGVPVVALAGDRMAARQSAAHLSAAGLGDLVAKNAEGYVSLAAALAADPARLAAMRGAMRKTLAASPLCDAAGFTRALEQAFRAMWRDWCARQG